MFEAIKAGAAGYILKKMPPSGILDAIQEIHDGGSPMSPEIARRVMESFHNAPVSKDLGSLTSRELSVLSLLATGKS